ncbi:type IV secretion system protein [Escherichia coli]|uniref:type IV secretion system protein n=1 Tax=Escherichia coli TaxID=562 RepID=UPI0020755C5B|nr:type IV secretion system protein [Escherichia coli]
MSCLITKCSHSTIQLFVQITPAECTERQLKIKTKIKSVTLLKPDVAQVRFSKMILDSSGSLAPEYRVTDWIATVAFDFNKDVKTERTTAY